MISGISPVSLRPALFTAELGTPPRKPFLEQLSLSQSLTFLSAVFQPLAVFKSLISFILSGMAAASQSLQQSRLPVSKSSAWPTAPPRNSASSTSWSCDDHQHSDSGRQLHPDVVFPGFRAASTFTTEFRYSPPPSFISLVLSDGISGPCHQPRYPLGYSYCESTAYTNMPDLTSAEPLVGDPARQAPDLHRGIVFQIWRSVEAWINLKEDELLYLEGAEDFDIVANGSAAAVQTKATSGNITLRTAAVLDAMVNYWLVRSNNPTKRVCFRYITTSAIGAEQGNPFGDRQSGLKIWQECAATRDLTQVAKLKTFLATDIVTAPCLNTKKYRQIGSARTEPPHVFENGFS
jgi:hypothetical protein